MSMSDILAALLFLLVPLIIIIIIIIINNNNDNDNNRDGQVGVSQSKVTLLRTSCPQSFGTLHNHIHWFNFNITHLDVLDFLFLYRKCHILRRLQKLYQINQEDWNCEFENSAVWFCTLEACSLDELTAVSSTVQLLVLVIKLILILLFVCIKITVGEFYSQNRLKSGLRKMTVCIFPEESTIKANNVCVS